MNSNGSPQLLWQNPANLNLARVCHDGRFDQLPQNYDPFVNMKLAKHQQEVVLSRMRQLGWITCRRSRSTRGKKIKRD